MPEDEKIPKDNKRRQKKEIKNNEQILEKILNDTTKANSNKNVQSKYNYKTIDANIQIYRDNNLDNSFGNIRKNMTSKNFFS